MAEARLRLRLLTLACILGVAPHPLAAQGYRFANIPWGSNGAAIKQLLADQGMNFVEVDTDGDYKFKGTLSGYEAVVWCLMSSSGVAKFSVTLFTPDEKARQAYRDMKAMLTTKYGAPAEVVEFFREYCGPTTRAFATLEETLERIFSMSRSASLLPSIRVDDPMLSIVAARRKADNRSGASVLSARQAPLNSSSFAMMSSISGSMTRVLVLMVPAINPAISSWYFAGKLKLGVDPRPKGQRGAMY